MKLGVHIGYWGLGLTSADQLGIVRAACRCDQFRFPLIKSRLQILKIVAHLLDSGG